MGCGTLSEEARSNAAGRRWARRPLLGRVLAGGDSHAGAKAAPLTDEDIAALRIVFDSWVTRNTWPKVSEIDHDPMPR